MKERTVGHRIQPLLRDYDQRTQYILYFSLGFNLFYALFKLITGIYYRSHWMGALGIYYAVLAFMRYSLMRSLHKGNEQSGRDVYRRTAWRLNFLTLTMTGIFAQMIMADETYRYPGVLIYAMAAWTFYKIIAAVINLIKRRRDENKGLAAARCVTFAGALMSILALQTAMITQFGERAVDFAHIMNGIGGAVVTGLLITLSALMIARSNGWKKEAENQPH